MCVCVYVCVCVLQNNCYCIILDYGIIMIVNDVDDNSMRQ